MTSSHASRLEALAALADEPCSERRRQLMREVGDAFFASTPLPPEAMYLFDKAVTKLTDDLELELRSELAQRLAPLSAAPQRLVARLIDDPSGEVAQPLLERSTALSEDDLLRVASTGGQLHLRAVSRRSDLTETISDQIVERGDDVTLGVLVSNPSAPLSRTASETVVARAQTNAVLAEAVVTRESLPVDLLNCMYPVVEKRLRQRIMARNAALSSDLFEAALDSSRTRMAQQQGALPTDYASALTSVERLLAVGPIAPATLAGFAKTGTKTKLTIALSKAAGVDYAVVQRVLARNDTDAFALLCRAAGFEDELFAQLCIELQLGIVEPVNVQVARFNKLPRQLAARIVRFWSVRQAAQAEAA